MYSSAQHGPASNSDLFRWLGRVSGSLLLIAWIAYVTQEVISQGAPSPGAVYQGAAFAVIFAGYALGWRHELAGGLLAILGTVAFFAIVGVSLGVLPQVAAAAFAVPGVLYLLAWRCDDGHRLRSARQA